jgi:hypothetical protein
MESGVSKDRGWMLQEPKLRMRILLCSDCFLHPPLMENKKKIRAGDGEGEGGSLT